MIKKKIPIKGISNYLILNHLNKKSKKTRDWKNLEKGIPFGSPSTKPLDIAKKAHNIFFPMNYNNIGLSTMYEEKKIYGTREIELAVINMVSNQLKIPSYHGYLTSGGTESNFMGIWLAREKLSNSKKIFLVKSSLTHYSIQKISRILNIKNLINSSLDDSYSMDPLLLKKKLTKLKVLNAIITVTLGHTCTGTLDNIPKIIKELRSIKEKNPKFRFIIHIDACLGGFPLGFLSKAEGVYFKYPEVKSISIDGHKFGFMPYPTSFFYCKKEMVKNIKRDIKYTNQIDATFSGSRSGLPAVYAYSTLLRLGKKGYINLFNKSIENKNYFINQLKKNLSVEIISEESIPVACVVFKNYKKIPKKIEKQFGLCAFNLPKTKNNKKKIAYKFYFMPTINKKIINYFLSKLKKYLK